MKVSDVQKSTVEAWVQKWSPRLLLQNHKINYYWRTRPCKDDKIKEVTTYAQVRGAYAGLEVDVEIFPAFWRLMEIDKQERITLHELLHVICPDADENAISVLTQILWNTFECTTGK